MIISVNAREVCAPPDPRGQNADHSGRLRGHVVRDRCGEDHAGARPQRLHSWEEAQTALLPDDGRGGQHQSCG